MKIWPWKYRSGHIRYFFYVATEIIHKSRDRNKFAFFRLGNGNPSNEEPYPTVQELFSDR
jgi:hypothetical protein